MKEVIIESIKGKTMAEPKAQAAANRGLLVIEELV